MAQEKQSTITLEELVKQTQVIKNFVSAQAACDAFDKMTADLTEFDQVYSLIKDKALIREKMRVFALSALKEHVMSLLGIEEEKEKAPTTAKPTFASLVASAPVPTPVSKKSWADESDEEDEKKVEEKPKTPAPKPAKTAVSQKRSENGYYPICEDSVVEQEFIDNSPPVYNKNNKRIPPKMSLQMLLSEEDRVLPPGKDHHLLNYVWKIINGKRIPVPPGWRRYSFEDGSIAYTPNTIEGVEPVHVAIFNEKHFCYELHKWDKEEEGYVVIPYEDFLGKDTGNGICTGMLSKQFGIFIS